ncbi:MAG TPA: L-histidine N(alpha)-methyltransferase [Longimicrobiales bacterium]|nr:L-histidine N(alpha)-methyltransferase [Longimicrobiales bacterium]
MSDGGSGTEVREATGTEAPPGMLDEVWASLTGRPRTLSSKYFYDTRGSELFVEITRLPEYYPTRTERALLEAWAPELVERHAPRALLELGAGSARKTRLLLDALVARRNDAAYLPQDVSGDFLEETARRIREEYPGLQVTPLVGDLTHPVDPSMDVPRPVMVALLGSTIGNFAEEQAREILGNVRAFLQPGDTFLMGADLRPSAGKTRDELEAAYNDARGVTAEFNRNILSVLNDRLGTDFEPERYRHRAFYDPREGRIEMHLVSEGAQLVEVPGRGAIRLDDGESIRTEISCKYDRPTVAALFRRAGMAVVEWRTDARERYALIVGAPVAP